MRSNSKAACLTISSIALLGNAAASLPAFPAMESFTVALSPQEQTDFAHPAGGTGDPHASGFVKLTVMPVERQICYDFSLHGVDSPMMAHVHRGTRLQIGPPIVSLFTGPGAPIEGCAAANTGQLTDMIADPSDYYVTLATTEYPDGALRGQLAG